MVSTHLKNISQIGNLPLVRVNIQNVWNHQLDPCLAPFLCEWVALPQGPWRSQVWLSKGCRIPYDQWRHIPWRVHGTNGMFTYKNGLDFCGKNDVYLIIRNSPMDPVGFMGNFYVFFCAENFWLLCSNVGWTFWFIGYHQMLRKESPRCEPKECD